MSKDKDYHQSTLSLRNILLSIIDDEAKDSYASDELSFLKSQSLLAKYSNDDLGITPSSLNTLKKNADSHLDGGFAYLDQLRLKALATVTASRRKKTNQGKTTKSGLKHKVDELERHIKILEENLMTLTKALDISIRRSRDYAESSGNSALIARCKNEQREILAMLSITHRENKKGNL